MLSQISECYGEVVFKHFLYVLEDLNYLPWRIGRLKDSGFKSCKVESVKVGKISSLLGRSQ